VNTHEEDDRAGGKHRVFARSRRLRGGPGARCKPAEAPKAEQKAEKTEKKVKETKADCLKMAKDDVAKADCEKKFAKAKKEAAAAAPKKEEAKKP
jgi:hypothetical protein